MSERFDSLDRHYKIIDQLNNATSWLFWINAFLSILVFFVDDFEQVKNFLFFIFILTTLAYFVIDNYLTIVKIPNVEDKRRVHLLSQSFNVPLDTERTNKFYNNNVEPSVLKLGVHIFENSLFAERVTYEMLKKERIKIVIFVAVFVVAFLFRTTEYEFIAILAQTIFASTLLPAYIRLRVLHSKNKAIFNSFYDLFLLHKDTNNGNEEKLTAKILDLFVKYESAKAYSGVKQDSGIFHKINPEITQEWEDIKVRLNIK